MTNPIQKSAESIAISAIDSARTTAIIKTGRASGKPDEEIVKEVFGEEGFKDLARSITIVNLLKSMGDVFDLHPEGDILQNKAFTGYAMILQHYPDEPAAKMYCEMYESAKTVEDVWNYFLLCNRLREDAIVSKPGYDHATFWSTLQKPIEINPPFTIVKGK